MFDSPTKMRSVLIPTLILWILLIGSGFTYGAVNSYVPANGGIWTTAVNWSLGHATTSSEDAKIIANSISYNKIVSFDTSDQCENLTVDSVTASFGMLLQDGGSLITDDLYLGINGEGWYHMEGTDPFLWVQHNMYVGYQDPGDGHVFMWSTDYGILVNNISYVGYSAPGDFDHRNGYHNCDHLFVGQNAPGTYWLKGSEETSTLETEYYMVVGNADVGTFEQTGGTVNSAGTSTYVAIGLNAGGDGTYSLKDGTLYADHISVGFAGDGRFNQTGGTVELGGDITLGTTGSNSNVARYDLSQADGTAKLTVGDDLRIGVIDPGTYNQSAGTADVVSDTHVYSIGEFYLSGGIFTTSTLTMDGWFDHSGSGTFEAANATVNSSTGMLMDHSSGDTRITKLTNDAGTVELVNGRLIGKHLSGTIFFLCDFTNNDEFIMSGGTFTGSLTNNDTFTYQGGDFSGSTLENYGTFTNSVAFNCKRLVNHASIRVYSGKPITANTTSHANAVENNKNFTMYTGSRVKCTGGLPFVNNDAMYCGGTFASNTVIEGDLINNDYLLPAPSTGTGVLYIDGDFTAASSAQLRIRLGGTIAGNQYDRLIIQDHATFAGTLDVRLINSFIPAVGNSFTVVRYGSHVNKFSRVLLPSLPIGLGWEVAYTTTSLILKVVATTGDLSGNGFVNLEDFAMFEPWWLEKGCGACGGADLANSDGYVGLADLAVLAENWLNTYVVP